MSDNFMAALETEIAALEDALRRDVRYIRLEELKRVRDLYAGGTLTEAASPHATEREMRPPQQRSARRGSSERARVIEAARSYVASRSGPVPTPEIYDHITGLGIVIAGANPRNNLSAILSSSGLFEAHGRSGWTLWEQSVAPQTEAPQTEAEGTAGHSERDDPSRAAPQESSSAPEPQQGLGPTVDERSGF